MWLAQTLGACRYALMYQLCTGCVNTLFKFKEPRNLSKLQTYRTWLYHRTQIKLLPSFSLSCIKTPLDKMVITPKTKKLILNASTKVSLLSNNLISTEARLTPKVIANCWLVDNRLLPLLLCSGGRSASVILLKAVKRNELKPPINKRVITIR